jgi:hypothetical protein
MRRLTALLALLILGFAASLASAADNWSVIGAVTFDDPWQRSTVVIPPSVGPLRAIRFDVRGADVEIDSFAVVYGNGQSDEFRVGDVFRGGTSSRRIDLRGRARNVKQVNIVYRAHGRTRITILGDALVVQPQWSELGCKTVGFFVDHDTINVGLGEGMFTALRLRVANRPVEFLDVMVVYGNGQRDTLRIRSVIPPGGMTRPIDLPGASRGIRRIEMLYQAAPSLTDKAVVCADGLAAP